MRSRATFRNSRTKRAWFSTDGTDAEWTHEGVDQWLSVKADLHPGFEELLMRGMPIPRYPELKLGLPGKGALVRAWTLHRPDLVHIATEGPLGWSALQAARNEATEIDAFTGARLNQASGWQTYYSGGAALEQQRLFGVPRLRHTLSLTFNSQQVERREFGDINATRRRVGAALESRIDYAVGRLALRFIGRVARIEDQTVVFLMARAQRSF